MDEELFKQKIKKYVAGETLSMDYFERYFRKATPLTMQTLVKAAKTEAYLNAVQDKVLTPGMKIALGAVFAGIIILAVVWQIFTAGG